MIRAYLSKENQEIQDILNCVQRARTGKVPLSLVGTDAKLSLFLGHPTLGVIVRISNFGQDKLRVSVHEHGQEIVETGHRLTTSLVIIRALEKLLPTITPESRQADGFFIAIDSIETQN